MANKNSEKKKATTKKKAETPKKQEVKKQERYILFKNGKEKKIIGEDGKFWFCEGTQYRKLSDLIQDVIFKEEQIEILIEETKEEKPEPIFEEGFDNIPDVSDLH